MAPTFSENNPKAVERAKRRSAWAVAVSVVAVVVAGSMVWVAAQQHKAADTARADAQTRVAELKWNDALAAYARFDTVQAIVRLKEAAEVDGQPGRRERARRLGTAWAAELPQLTAEVSVTKLTQLDFVDDERFYTVSDEGIRVWRTTDGQALTPFFKHAGAQIAWVLFSKERKQLVTAGGNSLQKWSLKTGKAADYAWSHPRVTGAAWSEDGSMIASWSPIELRVWTVQTGDMRISPVALDENNPGSGWRWVRDDQLLVLESSDPALAVDLTTGKWADFRNPVTEGRGWVVSNDGSRTVGLLDGAEACGVLTDTATGEALAPLPCGCEAATFSADSREVLLTGRGGCVMETKTGKVTHTIPAGRNQDGPMRAWMTPYGILWIQNTAAGTSRAVAGNFQLDHQRSVDHAQFIDQGARILSLSAAKLRVWDTSSADQVRDPLTAIPHVDPRFFRLSASQRLALNHQQGRVYAWRRPAANNKGRAAPHSPALMRVAVSPDEQGVVVANADVISLYTTSSTKVWGRPATGTKGAAFSRDGSGLLTWSDQQARVFDVLNYGEPLTPPLEHEGLTGALLTPDGVFTFGEGIKRWDWTAKPPRASVVRAGDYVRSEDGRTVMWKTEDGRTRVTDVLTEQTVVLEATAPMLPIHARFLADGTTVVTYGPFFSDPTAYDAKTGARVGAWKSATALTHRRNFGDATDDARGRVWTRWVTDDRLLVWGGVLTMRNAGQPNESDGFVHLWDPRTDDLIMQRSFSEPVLQAELSDDGTLLLTRCRGLFEVWSVPSGGRVWAVKATPREAARLIFSKEPLRPMGASPNFSTLVVGTEDGLRIHRLPAPAADFEAPAERIRKL